MLLMSATWRSNKQTRHQFDPINRTLTFRVAPSAELRKEPEVDFSQSWPRPHLYLVELLQLLYLQRENHQIRHCIYEGEATRKGIFPLTILVIDSHLTPILPFCATHPYVLEAQTWF